MELDSIRRICKNHEPGFVTQRNFFSVLIPLIRVEDEWHLLYEVRAYDLEAQPGEICFPGGALEKGEMPLEAALRETREETGARSDEIEVIGQGDTLVNTPKRAIYSYVGVIHRPLESLVKNDQEVDELFTIPLQYFLDNDPIVTPVSMVELPGEDFPFEEVHYPREETWDMGQYDIVFYNYPKDPPLWGLTAAFTWRFAQMLRAGGR